MKFSTAFREAMFRYELRGSDLSKRSGVSNAQISTFKSGQNINVATMEKLLAAMPQDARGPGRVAVFDWLRAQATIQPSRR